MPDESSSLFLQCVVIGYALSPAGRQTKIIGSTSHRRKGTAMLEELKNKTFASEAEEAVWWKAHEDELLEEFKKATKEGRVGIGTAAKHIASRSTSMRIPNNDIAIAEKQAAERGLRYQTYLKMIIHEALLAEEKRKSKVA
ncbi:hypothetical protein [Terracidiphilus sp.]|uniref:hypothetical protein n=1 Tax=Terracidiphilus sp. TaxID=1964191 RepID=UPI003C235DFC